jgi:hypothetical protein
MIVHSAFFITRCQTSVVFQPIDQPLHTLTEAIEGTIKGPGAVFILLARNGDADTVAAQVLPNRATPVGLVTHQTTRPAFGAPTPVPFHSPAFHQGGESHGFVPLARGEDQCHQLAPAFCTNMNFRTEAALTAAERLGFRAPCVGSRRVLVRADDGAIHIMDIPVELPGSGGTLLDRRKEASPDTRLAPAVEAAGDGLPGAIPFRHVAPRGTGTDDPQDAVEDAAVVSGWAACMRFLWGKQGVSPLPLPIGEVMSLHPRKDTTRTRVCKHALDLSHVVACREILQNAQKQVRLEDWQLLSAIGLGYTYQEVAGHIGYSPQYLKPKVSRLRAHLIQNKIWQ